MSVEKWSPGKDSSSQSLEPEVLKKLANIEQTGKLNQLAEKLTDHENKSLVFAMNADPSEWQEAAAKLNEDQLLSLIKVLVIAEMSLPGCLVGAKSPVIYLNSALKSRGYALSVEDLRWIKQNSTNRFLPNGPL